MSILLAFSLIFGTWALVIFLAKPSLAWGAEDAMWPLFVLLTIGCSGPLAAILVVA